MTPHISPVLVVLATVAFIEARLANNFARTVDLIGAIARTAVLAVGSAAHDRS